MSAAPGTSSTSMPVIARPRRVLISASIGGVALIGVFVVLAGLLPNVDTGVYFRVADQVAMVLLGLFMAGGLLLLGRPRVRADAAGIEVRNIVLTRRYSWDQVERVAFADGASWARLDLPDDEYLPVLAVQAVDGRRAVEAMTKLRALHAAARAHPAG